ncbi:MAG: hypothetical protein A2147_02475 [Chloroflexi bacterium RBG_16_57_8]|nr:MAG: hypothetical protein A2147_02475 [Chloroflexi bacterium RBG_16_57_8]
MNEQQLEQMLFSDRAEWHRLVAILDAHPNEVLHSENSPRWTSRDVYAHLARWIAYSNREMIAYLSGDATSPSFDDSDIDKINSAWQKEDSGMSLGQARRRAHEMFEERMNMLEAIPLNRWDETLQKMARYDGSEHLAAHRGYIRAIASD